MLPVVLVLIIVVLEVPGAFLTFKLSVVLTLLPIVILASVD